MNFYYLGHNEMSVDIMLETLASASVIAIDTETVSLKDRSPVGIGIATSQTDAFFFPSTSPYIDPVADLLSNPAVTKVYHNAVFDMDVIAKTWGVVTENNHDTMLLCAHCNYPQQLEMAAVLVDRYDITPASILLKGGKTMLDLDIATVADHCMRDCQVTLGLHDYFREKAEFSYLPYAIERRLLPIIISLQQVGLKIDHFVREEIQNDLEKDVAYYLQLCDGMGFNPGSPQQVGYTLANRGVFLPFNKSKAGKLSLNTSEEVLSQVSDPVAQLVLLYRQASKLLSTYVRPLEGKERAFTHLHMNTVTGRFGSARMNLQNIPEKLRMMFVPDDPPFTDVDFNQIELRVLAMVSGDKKMAEIFSDPNGDIHAATMETIGTTDRRVAKGINFGISYGETAQGLVIYCLKEGVSIDLYRAQEFMDNWMEGFYGARNWMEDTKAWAKNSGYTRTPMGRHMYIEKLQDNRWHVREEGLRQAINWPIQGGAAEKVKLAMIELHDLPLLLQVHDSFLFNGYVKLPDLSHIDGMDTPFKVKLTQHWS